LSAALVEAGIASEAQVREALAEGLRSGEGLGELALARGWLSESRLAELLAAQWQLRVAEPGSLVLDPDALGRLGSARARAIGAVPIAFDASGVVVAIAEPGQSLFDAVARELGAASYVVVTHGVLEGLVRQVQLVEAGGEAVIETSAGAAPEPAPPLELAASGVRARLPERGEHDDDDDPPVSLPGGLGRVLEAVDGALAELRRLRGELAGLSAEVARAREQALRAELRLAEVRAERERQAETVGRLEAELAKGGDLFATLRQQVALLTRTVEGGGSPS
jgi:hypothetical protein